MAERATSDAETLTLLAPQLEDGYTWYRERLTRFRQIEPPAEDRDIIDKLWQLQEQSGALVARLADAADRGDAAAFSSLTDEQDRLDNRASGLAQGYGFKECGSGKNKAD